MQHGHAVEAIDRTLRDFLDQPDLPFGGITVAFRGDFQQTLPIVPKGSEEEIVGACLQRSFMWPKIKVLNLLHFCHLHPLVLFLKYKYEYVVDMVLV